LSLISNDEPQERLGEEVREATMHFSGEGNTSGNVLAANLDTNLSAGLLHFISVLFFVDRL
jgi:hypothetical protein